MTDLRTAAQQALKALEEADTYHRNQPDQRSRRLAAMAALRAALAQQEEPDAYGYAARLAVAIWEKYYKDTAPDWKPLDDLVGVLTQIDNMTSGLTRLAQHAEPQGCATEEDCTKQPWCRIRGECQRKQAEPAQKTVAVARVDDLERGGRVRALAMGLGLDTPLYTAPPRCPNCASLEAQNTELDRKLAEMEQAEPAQAPVTWVASEDGCVIYDDISMDDVVLRVSGDFETDEQRIRCAKRIADALNAAPPRRTMVPLTAQQLDGVIERHVGGSEITDDVYASMEQFARAIEKASWEKNHG